jgi:hypothetical protein
VPDDLQGGLLNPEQSQRFVDLLKKSDELLVEPEVRCGNARHPNGAWHPAAPLPMFTIWAWRARLAYWWRTRKWGCGCPAI